MLSIDFSHIFDVGSHGMTKKQFVAYKKLLKPSLKSFELRAQGFHTIVDDMATAREIMQYAKEVQGQFDDVVVFGIGGSSLGALCLREAFTHLYGKKEKNQPRLHVLDNIDPIMVQELNDVIDLQRTLFIVISRWLYRLCLPLKLPDNSLGSINSTP